MKHIKTPSPELQEMKATRPATISVPEAAAIMGVTPQFLRAALMQDKFPFRRWCKNDAE